MILFLVVPRRPRSTHFPITTLFRSAQHGPDQQQGEGRREEGSPRPQDAAQGEPGRRQRRQAEAGGDERRRRDLRRAPPPDRKSTRLNSSHANISYAVFCLKTNKNIG